MRIRPVTPRPPKRNRLARLRPPLKRKTKPIAPAGCLRGWRIFSKGRGFAGDDRGPRSLPDPRRAIQSALPPRRRGLGEDASPGRHLPFDPREVSRAPRALSDRGSLHELFHRGPPGKNAAQLPRAVSHGQRAVDRRLGLSGIQAGHSGRIPAHLQATRKPGRADRACRRTGIRG